MSPTSSSVTEPTETSSVADRDNGRMTLSAPVRSSCVNAGGLPSALARAAARSAASRTSAARSATTKPGVRSAISSRLSSPDGTSRSSTSSSCLRMAPSGRLSPSSRSHRSGARSRGSTLSGTAEVATNATPPVATAVRSSVRISVATGSAGEGSSASMSVMSSTPPPSRTVATADDTLVSRSSARSAPTSGPSSSTSRRSAHTVRTRVALPTPAGPDTSTPRLAVAPSVSRSSGWSSASLSHSVSRPACAWAPLRSSMLTAVGSTPWEW